MLKAIEVGRDSRGFWKCEYYHDAMWLEATDVVCDQELET